MLITTVVVTTPTHNIRDSSDRFYSGRFLYTSLLNILKIINIRIIMIKTHLRGIFVKYH